MSDRPITTAELSELLGIPGGTLRYWRSMVPPEGPRCYKLGRKRIVYDPADVAEWLNASKVTTARGGVA